MLQDIVDGFLQDALVVGFVSCVAGLQTEFLGFQGLVGRQVLLLSLIDNLQFVDALNPELAGLAFGGAGNPVNFDTLV